MGIGGGAGTEAEARQPHAVLDLVSRRWKAQKIERLLGLERRLHPIRLLEVGTGSGGIAHYFATHPRLNCEVTAVDVVDNRQVTAGYAYRLVNGVKLPFSDGAFDVVLSNHVIEHVGYGVAQSRHLSELRRVMASTGVGYLAVPNRWMLREPHYGLLFLSWLPRGWRSPYLRVMKKGAHYDCEPLEQRQLERMLGKAGFSWRNVGVDALRATFEIERPQSMSLRILGLIPDRAVVAFLALIPTLIYRIEHGQE